jgi:hypothetical protein
LYGQTYARRAWRAPVSVPHFALNSPAGAWRTIFRTASIPDAEEPMAAVCADREECGRDASFLKG